MVLKIFKNQKLFIVAFWFCLAVIEFLATTTTHIEIVESMWDKSNHFIAFLTLYILLKLAYDFSVLKTSFLLFLYGVQIEVVQSFIPGRFFSLLDVVADSIGIALGVVIYRYFIYQLHPKTHHS